MLRRIDWMSYCPFESRYKELHRDTAVMGVAAKATTWQSMPHNTARSARNTAGSAPARGLAQGEFHDTKFCIVTRARAWPLGVVSRYSLCIMTGGRSG